MRTYNLSDCSSFFSACQIGAEISRKLFYSKEALQEETLYELQGIEVNNVFQISQSQQDLLRLEVAAAMVCQAVRIRSLNPNDDYDHNDNNTYIEAPSEFFASYFHNVLGFDVEWNMLSEAVNTNTIDLLRSLWHNIATQPMQYYRSELQPILMKYSNLLTDTEQMVLQYGFETGLYSFDRDGLYYRYSLLCKAAEGITIREFNREFERQGYQGIISDLNDIRKKEIGSPHIQGIEFAKRRSICIAHVISFRKDEWFCAVSGLWDRSQLGVPWTQKQKHMPQPLFPQTEYDIRLEKQLDSIIRKLPNKTKWCKTSKNVESYFDPNGPLKQPVTLLHTLKKVFINGQKNIYWKRLFSCGERKILCKLAPKFHNVCRIEFFIDRKPCNICDYSIKQICSMNGIKVIIKYIQ
ncbi:MAG: hypothetical protein ACI4J7_09435 [Ruminiclostridium sp.]